MLYSAIRHRLSILIPAYQEEDTIAEVLRRVAAADTGTHGFDKEVVVCDDGSTDDTVREIEREAADNKCIRLLRHPTNRGKGASIRTMLASAAGDYCLIQDADLEYEIDDYPAILQAFNDGADVVYGSRFLQRSYPEGMRLPNWVANRVLTLTANVLFGLGITDEATCFKALRTDILRELSLACDGFDFCPEVTAKLGRRGIRIVEVPVSYSARNHRQGKKIRWTHGLEAMKTLLKYRFTE
jgi:glycosyltransferase involved in cell wall biosynthesis